LKDFNELDRKIKNFTLNFEKYAEKAAFRFGTAVIQHSRKNYLRGQALNVGTGKLFNSMGVAKEKGGVVIGSIMDGGVIYSRIHEYGGTILPKKAKALRFKIGNKWVVTKKVNMPKRPYLIPAIQDKVEDKTGQKILIRLLKEDWDNL
jgi:phage gpG-like protein